MIAVYVSHGVILQLIFSTKKKKKQCLKPKAIIGTNLSLSTVWSMADNLLRVNECANFRFQIVLELKQLQTRQSDKLAL